MCWKDWLPLVGLTCAVFVFNTSEFVPIALLTDIAADFRTTEAHAGMLISVYAWMVMLLSLPLMLLVSKMELRRLMLWIVAGFVAFQMLSAVSANYWMLMLARIGVACTHAVFWSIVSPFAVSIAPPNKQPLALSMIVTGSSVAMILGMPLGRVIGLYVGWRMAFLSIGLFALAVLVFLFFALPKVPSHGGFSAKQLPSLLRNPLIMGCYVLTFLVATAYYTGYSYIEPYLLQVAGFSESGITATLMFFGGAGIVGSWLFSRFFPRTPVRFITCTLVGEALCLFLLFPLRDAHVVLVVLCALWGMAVTAYNVSFQSEIIHITTDDATPVAMSIFSGIFNLGIATGTLLGGQVCTHASIGYIGYAGGAVACCALVYWLLHMAKCFCKPQPTCVPDAK